MTVEARWRGLREEGSSAQLERGQPSSSCSDSHDRPLPACAGLQFDRYSNQLILLIVHRTIIVLIPARASLLRREIRRCGPRVAPRARLPALLCAVAVAVASLCTPLALSSPRSPRSSLSPALGSPLLSSEREARTSDHDRAWRNSADAAAEWRDERGGSCERQQRGLTPSRMTDGRCRLLSRVPSLLPRWPLLPLARPLARRIVAWIWTRTRRCSTRRSARCGSIRRSEDDDHETE